MKGLAKPLFSLLLLFAFCGAAQADPAFVTQRASLGANDFVDWGTLGAADTIVNHPFDIVSNQGLSMNVSMTQAGYSFRRTDQWSGTDPFTGWDGNFAVGDRVLWTGYDSWPLAYHNGPMTLVFASPVSGAGAQIQANEPGAFVATIEAYDAGNTSLGSFQANGTSNTNRDNSAIFIGIKSSTANIVRLVFNVTEVTPPPFMGDRSFAVNRLDLIDAGFSPSNPSIPDGATAVSIRPPFAWQAVNGAIAYDLYLWRGGESKPATPTGKDMPGAMMTLAVPLAPLTLYRWQVVARKASGMAAGPEWSFTTGYFLAGDLNDDKAVDLRDGILALRTITGLNPAGIRSGYAACGADANGDGTVGLADAAYILQTCAGSRADTVPPRVSSTEPSDNATGVDVGRGITAAFSEEMDASTLTASTFTLNQGETYIAGSVSYNAVSRTAAFTPGAPLSPASAYTATISTGARDLAGNALAASHLFGFTTAGLSAVIGTSPMNGDSNVSVDYPWIQIEFASDMDGDSLMEAFTLTEAGGAPVAGTLTYYPPGELAILRFVPDAPLSPFTAYTGVLSTSAKSAGGIPIGSPYVFTFTTGAGP